MTGMEILLIALLVVVAGAAVVIAWQLAARRPVVPTAPAATPDDVARAVADAVAEANRRASAERDQLVETATRQMLTVSQQALGSHTQAATQTLQSRNEVIDQRLDAVQRSMADQLQQLTGMVQQLGQVTQQKFGEVDQSLRSHAEVTYALQDTTRGLREALANTNARGQWGERMAEDVLRLAGMLPNVNYRKRTAVTGEGRAIPDFTFMLPDQHVMFMDVKFPIDAYLQYLQATSEAERSAHRDSFLRSVRGHVRELARRDYARTDDRPAVDNVLMFVPNETIVGFIHEHAPDLVDDAMSQRVVLCSPLTLFAFLGVIRQAFDNFRLEQTSREILALMGTFDVQWGKYSEQVEKVKRAFDSVSKNFDELVGTRRRALERPLDQITALRTAQHVPLDGQLFLTDAGTDTLASDDFDDDPVVRRLGA
jgi:DNA recombination protein RmuC